MFVIGPLTQYYLSRTWGTGGFAHQWLLHLTDGEWMSETGPMWFCAALLMFSIIYALIRFAGCKEPEIKLSGNDRQNVSLAAFIAIMAASTFLVRIAVTEDVSVLNMHPGDFPQYALMFAAGALGYRMLALAVVLFVALILFGGALQGDTTPYAGGFNSVSAAKCLWEALVCVGIGLLMLAVYRRHFDFQNEVARWLSDNAFGIYLIHPPILIGFAILLHGLTFPPVAKAALLTVLATIGSFAASALVLRNSPLRRII